jgi:hypothetical protein
MGLLLFIVIVGLPIVGVPHLRERLSTRIQTLKAAIAGDVSPATLQVGAQHEPFPSEFEEPEPLAPQPPKLPQMDRVYTLTPSRTYTPSASPQTETADRSATEPSVTFTDEGETESGTPAEPEIEYLQGQAEEDAYNLLLQSNSKVAELVKGGDPSLKFKSWDAARRGDDVFRVRLKFQSEGHPEAEYIWQVKLQSNEVTPLSYNARTIS